MTAGPYPYLGINILKLFTDAQVFAVALVGLNSSLVGLVLRIDVPTMLKEGNFDREIYGAVLVCVACGLLWRQSYQASLQLPTSTCSPVAIARAPGTDIPAGRCGGPR